MTTPTSSHRTWTNEGGHVRALDELEDTHLIFTMPNADTDGRVLIQMVEEFCATRSHAKAFTSLGQLRYFSCIQHTDGVVGNSSSGLAEAPSFRKATLNIGARQKGRAQAASVINCHPNKQSIADGLAKILSEEHQYKSKSAISPYGEGGAASRIRSILESTNPLAISTKVFWDAKRQ